MMDAATKGRKRIGTIRWAVALAIIITISAVISYLLTSGIRYVYFDGENDNFLIWSTAIYQIMGSITGVVITMIALMLYRRMEKLCSVQSLGAMRARACSFCCNLIGQ